MIANVEGIKSTWRRLLGDPNGLRFTDALFSDVFPLAYDALINGAHQAQVPKLTNIQQYNLPVNTTSLTPATAGISDFADLEYIEERQLGSTDRYTLLTDKDKLSQRDPTDRLVEFVYRADTFFFIGATTARDLRITYEISGTAPTSGSIGWDGVQSFLSLFAAGVAGPLKGLDELGGKYMQQAVGPKYDLGTIGGELFRVLQPRVRSRQHVQVAPKPYTATRRLFARAVPYVAAQQPIGAGTAPAQFKTSDGTITGTIDGTNATFYLAYPVRIAQIYRNGILMTQQEDVVFGANQMIFQAGQIPVPGDLLTAEGWI
jgi:hypothetical protein